MKSKLLFGLLAMMLVLALAPSSFAQVQIIISNTPSSQEIQTNRNAQVSDVTSVGAGITVTGALVANSPLTTTTLTLQFPAPITSSSAVVSGQAGAGLPPLGAVPNAADGIRIEGGTGVFASITAVTSVNYNAGTITVTLPGFDDPATVPIEANTLSGSFRLLGVRVDANGKTAPLTVTGALGSSANNYFPPTAGATLVSALGPGIASMAVGARGGSPTVTSDGTATIFTNRTVADTLASIVIGEGFASAWRNNTQLSNRGVGADIPNSTNILLTFAGVPAGVTLALTASGNGVTGLALSNAAITSTALTTTISFTGAPSLTTTNQIDVRMVASTVAGANFTAGTITVTATMTPNGDALSSAAGSINTPTTAGGFPRFAVENVGPVTVASIVPSATTMLIPFAVRDGAFDTGIAIANTTSDPFGSANGGATAAAGNITLSFFPRTSTGAGTSVTSTTSTTIRPGIGLGTDGTLAAGGTWTVLLSELLGATGQTGSFTGYIFIQANFPNAHGSSFVSDFRNFTSFSPVLVLAAPNITARTGTSEVLGL